MTLAPSAVLSRSATLIEAEVDDELLGLHIDSGLCYGLNATAAAIWNRIATPLRFDALVDWLVGEFSVAHDQCVVEASALIAELAADGLIRIDGDPAH